MGRLKKPKPTDQDVAPPIGDNSALNVAARDQLRSLVDRIESIEHERAELAEDVRGLYQEAKSVGFDVAALRQIIRMRKQDKGERDTRRAIVDAYMAALGDYGSTPLGQAAIARAGAELMPPV